MTRFALLLIILFAACNADPQPIENHPSPPPSPACSAPTSTTACVTGVVRDFVTGELVAPTATSHLVARIYDPIAFVLSPDSAKPLATVEIGDGGRYLADGIQRTSSGLLAVAIDDAKGAADAYATTGVGAILRSGENVTDLEAYAISNADVTRWNQAAAGVPGCSSGMLDCGIWIGRFLDQSGQPVAGVKPSRPGDDPLASNVFCFRGTPATLTAEDTTDGTGLCAIVGDVVESHTGVCSQGGCTCEGAACAPTWGTFTGGTAPGVLFVQTFQAN